LELLPHSVDSHSRTASGEASKEKRTIITSIKPFGLAQRRKAAFETVAQAELPVLYRVARRLTLDPSRAEDLVSQTLLDAARAWDAFDGRFPRSWLIKILQNNFRRDLRRAASQPETVSLETPVEATCEIWHELNWRAIGSRLMEELDKLPEEYRLAVTLCDVEELSYEEAADAMGVPKGTVRSRLFRGRRMLRNKLASFVDMEETDVAQA